MTGLHQQTSIIIPGSLCVGGPVHTFSTQVEIHVVFMYSIYVTVDKMRGENTESPVNKNPLASKRFSKRKA